MIKIEPEKPKLTDTKLMTMWTMVTALHLTKFCIAEVEPYKMKMQQKQRYMNLRRAIDSFFMISKSNRSPAERAFFDETSFESVGIMMETMGMVAHVHPEQQDWFLNEVNKLVHVSVNRQNSINHER
jgi:hypothetical protein